jgi:hypothetical protein
MKIDLPVIEHMLKVLVKSSEGEVVKVLDSSHRSFEIDLPDSVLEDEVGVSAMTLDVCGCPVGDVIVLKEADVPEPEEKDDEDAPVEADEEAAKSPPAESDHKEADEEVTCDLKILLDSVTSAPVLTKEEKPEKSKKPRRVR